MEWIPQYTLGVARRKVVSTKEYHFDARSRRPESPRGSLFFQYTVSGKGMVELGEERRETHELPPGVGFLAIIPGPNRNWFPGGRKPWEFLLVSVRVPVLEQSFVEMVENLCGVRAFPRDCPLVRLAEHYIHLQEERPETLDGYARSALAYGFLMELFRHFDPNAPSGALPPTLAKAIRFIDSRLPEAASLPEIARHAGVTPQTVIRAFRQRLDTTPIQYQMLRRIELAKNKLTETGLPVKAVAADTGFSTCRYFCQRFREYTGYSPGEFRKRGVAEAFETADASLPFAR